MVANLIRKMRFECITTTVPIVDSLHEMIITSGKVTNDDTHRKPPYQLTEKCINSRDFLALE